MRYSNIPHDSLGSSCPETSVDCVGVDRMMLAWQLSALAVDRRREQAILVSAALKASADVRDESSASAKADWRRSSGSKSSLAVVY